ncbi:unnamed protein product, partial [Protopolystoma xenopodis]
MVTKAMLLALKADADESLGGCGEDVLSRSDGRGDLSDTRDAAESQGA